MAADVPGASLEVCLVRCCVCVFIPQEGRQASLAADFSITQFRYVGRLLVWHGRNRYNPQYDTMQYN